ncbi:tricarballylate utilization 4Fe-4S protein TcuB [Schinkia azotoformans]|uniref:tricarballylate utilization 4Fe-4S protein TcuB n=1 Tax=Schinkia azotoformans TaxID=1454 RepID=UPI002DB729D3|nr:tricarballylate utilization 4Fe-4S protein TcuB [Schinkia azotoformans]MEC1716071.1 tricarballylate utilization 4Fe-4S protein TcuB [Schinkia azotoformans]MEC1740542.1 tricarballylate utilization 4Fe-4S protein TcuB [Schinkia azotoformans]MEC1756110.1 tricarballylate utilization 4Fe-4S protein TcuB [Schinkia azotoformans]MEC1768853.1 tricarballylate utilization 4Fe-4S protein TcuB [Schinkia azotoformans]MEC1788409.1 tricarballylate utilization 4Fe-4S protein TcuB [Schinkia azotoformans]
MESKDSRDLDLMQDGKRQMELCNACRYCEGYCAVWRAIEWRRDFTDNDMTYLANLCHDCRDCYYACPFTTPHEFGINPPQLFAGLREETYRKYAWPGKWAKALGDSVSGFWATFVFGILFILGFMFVNGGMEGMFQPQSGEGAFYTVFPKTLMTVVFTVLGLWMVGGWGIGASKFWRDVRSTKSEKDKVLFKDIKTATLYAASLKYLDGEGAGCTYPSEEPAKARRTFHHLVGYGFLLDLASTTLAAFYDHFLHIPAPYPLFHPVVILGSVGGIMLIIGLCGLLYLKSKSDKEVNDEKAVKTGSAFSVALLIVAVTGMVLLAVRETGAMQMLLAIHLGSVAALFFTAPYSKFSHFVYRYLALVNFAQEERVAHEAKVVHKEKTVKKPVAIVEGIASKQ